MIIRNLDTSSDWTFGLGKQNYLSQDKGIVLNIRTRLYEFLNDAFWNMSAGIDWPRLLGAPGTQAELMLSVRSVILQSYGVTGMNSLSAVYDSSRRTILITAFINTNFTQGLSLQMSFSTEQLIGG